MHTRSTLLKVTLLSLLVATLAQLPAGAGEPAPADTYPQDIFAPPGS